MGRWIGWALGRVADRGGAAQAAVTVSQGEYHGWTGAYRLSNGTVDLVFVPQIGRIMRYGYVGERNVLWENPALAGKTTDLSRPVNDWQNYGGDKLWPAPQSVWGWPPDPVSDSGPQTVKVLPNRHLLMTGPESRKYGVRFQREIALDPVRNRRHDPEYDGERRGQTGRVGHLGSRADRRSRGDRVCGEREASFPGGYKVFDEQKPAAGQVTSAGRGGDHSTAGGP